MCKECQLQVLEAMRRLVPTIRFAPCDVDDDNARHALPPASTSTRRALIELGAATSLLEAVQQPMRRARAACASDALTQREQPGDLLPRLRRALFVCARSANVPDDVADDTEPSNDAATLAHATLRAWREAAAAAASSSSSTRVALPPAPGVDALRALFGDDDAAQHVAKWLNTCLARAPAGKFAFDDVFDSFAGVEMEKN